MRKGPPDVMQRKPHKKLFTKMWGGSPSNMLHASNCQGGFTGTTTSSGVGHGVTKARKRDVFGNGGAPVPNSWVTNKLH